MIGAAKRILPNAFREPSAYGILQDVTHCSLDGVAGPQDMVVVALLPEAVNLELFSRDILNTLLRQFCVAAQIRGRSQAFDDEMNMVWHHTVRRSGKHFELAGFQDLIACRVRRFGRIEDTPPRFRDEAQ